MSIEIKEGTIKTVVQLSKEIDEFHNPHDELEYQKRLTNVPHLILVAYMDGKPVGFKVGYERSGQFYSWMGAVLKDYRRKSVAKTLAVHQESWARQQGYRSVTFKTRNRLQGMLIFSIRNGFQIIEVEKRADIGESRILLRKDL